VWRVVLPGRDDEAEALLRDGETRLAHARASLASVPSRLGALGARAAASGSPLPSVSFDVARVEALDAPEAELWRSLTGAAPGWPSYGLAEALGPAPAAALTAYRTFLDQLGRQLGQLAWVETVWNGELLARSVVGWTGDARTGWRGRPAPERARSHARALALAVGSRLLWLQTAITVVQGAAQISLWLAMPGGAALAVPAILHFVNQVAEQARRHAQLAKAYGGQSWPTS
jgi:hypothetical protein